jgi:hypothetical protein
MSPRLFFRFLLVAGAVLLVPIMGAPGANSASVHTPATIAQCKNGGWRHLTDGQGQPFTNQGSCISYSIHHPVGLADLAGSFTGTQTFTFLTNGCLFVHQIFNATYPGSASVGTVTLEVQGCVSPDITHYDGTFTLSTSVGSVSGTAAGPIDFSASPNFDLTADVTSETGAFAGIAGTLRITIDWPGSDAITGSVATT